MKQFWDIKEKYPNSILLFRMGDFYETFDEDAKISSEILGITLTKRANGAAASVPLAGFPYHSLNQYLYKLLNSGYRVAICEQVEDPKESKGIVKREVVEVLSPGAAIAENFIDANSSNYLLSIYYEKFKIGYSILDYSTGSFFTGESKIKFLSDIIRKYNIKEILIAEHQKSFFNLNDKNIITTYPRWMSDYSSCYEKLIEHFKINSLKGYGIDKDKLSIISSGATIFYLENNFFGRIKHICSISKIINSDFMKLDSFTIRNLEIFKSIYDNSTKNTLINVIDNTSTSMGSRLLKNHIIKPLTNLKNINRRLTCVEELVENISFHNKLKNYLTEIFDIERIVGRIASNKANPKDLINLSKSLNILNLIIDNKIKNTKAINRLVNKSKNSINIIKKINNNINQDAPIDIKKGGFVKDGVSLDLDEFRKISKNANKWLVDYQEKLKTDTGISSLKIGFNKVFGYFIDVTKTHVDKVPEYFIRKQTLTNSERYFTTELKEYEDKILSSTEKIKAIEIQIFKEIVNYIVDKIDIIQFNANIIARLDVMSSHAQTANKFNYIKPDFSNKSNMIKLENSRHPVVESLLPPGERFVPNDLLIDNNKHQIAVITGPNMAGKSTFLRQIGIISILGQIGSFVPCSKARICVVDQLFTRVGASDNLSSGESTFLVEMNETAAILNNATKNSLILLDEIGRGTSTFDGLSIAWAVIEYLHNNPEIKAKTLFASHYHELIDLVNELPNAFNLNVSVEEHDDRIIFLRKIKNGGASKSYGINVAKMAGVPQSILIRANELLKKFTDTNIENSINVETEYVDIKQLQIFNNNEGIIDELKRININDLKPIDALNIIYELKNKINEK